MKNHLKRMFLAVAALLVLGAVMGIVSCTSFEKNYPATAVGVVEIKTLPTARVIETSADADYYQKNDVMFMRLFNYIKANDIAMTVPVEGDLKPGKMRFFVEEKLAAKQFKDTANVQVHTMPTRKVVSCGARGGYDKGSFDKVCAKLTDWLKAHPEIKTKAEPYAVFWDGPFTPAPLRRLEVHVLID